MLASTLLTTLPLGGGVSGRRSVSVMASYVQVSTSPISQTTWSPEGTSVPPAVSLT